MNSEFVEILNSHRALIYKVCNLYCPDRDDREDLFQEIVIQVWKALPGFRRESKLSTWMYRIALNTAITHFRKSKRSLNTISLTGIDLPDIHSSDEKEESFRQLFAAIENLDRIDKSIVLLYLDEKSYEEIGEITGLSKTNVGVRLNRIKQKLTNTLTK
jgi:RNA polymerase sigma-70 factor (ECF subfamily)